ncbi:hypothetical protein F4680DRAFT_427982 [Xylaria scruposa]|nr:hypothetical protein F4680DRAFT_427982 [Xylaria scruposa]
MSSTAPVVNPCDIPAAALPDGETEPNFTNPVSLQTVTIAVSIVLLVITYLFVGARTWVRKRQLSWSDYVSVAALVLHTGNVGIIISLSRYNRHQWDIPACWFTATYLKQLFAQVITFGITLLFSKAAIFLLYLEIFGIKASLRKAVYAGLAFNVLTYLTFIPIGAYYEAPHAGLPWESLFTHPGAYALMPWGIFIGAASVLIDIYVFILPLPTILKLNMSTSKRLQLLAVFGTAFVGVAASVVALSYRIQLFIHQNDGTWNQASIAIANVAEDSIALIVGSAPGFSTFLRVHVASSVLWKSIQSASQSVLGGAKSSPPGTESEPWRMSRTFGSPKALRGAKQNAGIELTDSSILNATIASAQSTNKNEAGMQSAACFNDQEGIVRTVDVVQHVHSGHGSTDHLV